MVPVGLWFTSVTKLKQETGVSLDPKFHRNQSVDRKWKEAELKSREKIQVKSLKQRPRCGASSDILFQISGPHTVDSVAKSLGQVSAGLTSPGPGSFLVWTQEGSEIRVAGRKGGQSRAGGSPSARGSALPSPPGPWLQLLQGSAHSGQAASDSWGERPGQGCLSRQVSGSELPRGAWSRVGWTRERGRPRRQFQPHS